jgi:acyl-CoA hydrolase
MQPEHANPAGNVHGGEIMKLMDHAAGIVALRHARTNVVTARVDNLEFHHPVRIGNLVTCEAHLTFVGKSSMEVSVTVSVEDLFREEEENRVALTALFTMVALDRDGKTVAVPPLELVSDEERQAFEAGRQRNLAYKSRRNSS